MPLTPLDIMPWEHGRTIGFIPVHTLDPRILTLACYPCVECGCPIGEGVADEDNLAVGYIVDVAPVFGKRVRGGRRRVTGSRLVYRHRACEAILNKPKGRDQNKNIAPENIAPRSARDADGFDCCGL